MFLVNVNSRPSVICLSVCCLSVTLVRPTQVIVIFGNISTPFGILAFAVRQKFYGDRPRGTPPSGGGRGLNQRRVAKYSDFGPFQGYIYETVQGRSVTATVRGSTG